MTSRVIPVAPFVLTVFGATGDLARRKLLACSLALRRAPTASDIFWCP